MSHQFFFSPHILDNLVPPATGFDVVQDISEPRLRLYITARGVKTFFTRKRVRGRTPGAGRDARIIIGRYPDTDIGAARARVLEILSAARAPRAARHKKITYEKLCAEFVRKKIRRAAPSLDKLERAMRRLWSPIYPKNIAEITPADLAALNKRIAASSGVPTANRMLEIMSSVFKFAVESRIIPDNPAASLAKSPESRRRRTLNADGLRRIIAAIGAERDPTLRPAFLMLVYGFESRSRVFSMQWRDLDFNNDTWGNRPLSDMAVVLLRDMPQDGRWVFRGRVASRHLTDPRVAWARVAARAGAPGTRMDDVHKFLMRSLEFSPHREQLRRNMNRVLNEVIGR
ncbi:MAG: integrase family protein [Proteobacteria bacterium]|nr:integrase family protein [Pseudomonadota bacterium]